MAMLQQLRVWIWCFLTVPPTLKQVRTSLFVLAALIATYTSLWDGSGLLWSGVSGIADIALFLSPALALPIAVLANWHSSVAASIFLLGYVLNIGFQMRVFGATLKQLVSNYSGFWELSLTAYLLASLAVTDVIINRRIGAEQEQDSREQWLYHHPVVSYWKQAWLLKKSLQWQKPPKLGDQKCIRGGENRL
jgi:hypothetical protein